MKEKQEQNRCREPLSREMFFRRNPIPFGDARKYYYLGAVGAVAILVLCFHISVVAIAIRTDTCVQIQNGIVLIILLCAGLNILGHYLRSIGGYVLSISMCFAILVILQFYNGGISLQSDLPEYGEVFCNAAKSTDFWILIAKVLAVLQAFFSIVFIKSALTLWEVSSFDEANKSNGRLYSWLDRRAPLVGRKTLDYWFAAVELILWMLMASADVGSTTKYDYWAMGFLFAGLCFIGIEQALGGALFVVVSFLTQCTMYQFRFGFRLPVIAAYVGLWVSLLFCLVEVIYARRVAGTRMNWGAEIKGVFKIQILVHPKQEESKGIKLYKRGLLIGSVALIVLTIPVHEVLSTFSGSYMIYQKDNLPLLFFLPIVILLCVYSDCVIGFLSATVMSYWFIDTILSSSYEGANLFKFDSVSQHGVIGELTTKRMNDLVQGIVWVACLFALASAVMAIIQARRIYREAK